MSNIIFLDIDGVLNHEQWYQKLHTTLTKLELDNLTFEQFNIDDNVIELLNNLCKSTNSKVVISSTWRRGVTTDSLQETLTSRGATFEVIDKTGECCSGIRGVEIYNWWNENGKDFNNYVILDDDSDFLLQQGKHFFWIDRWCGLTPTICYKVENFLNNHITSVI